MALKNKIKDLSESRGFNLLTWNVEGKGSAEDIDKALLTSEKNENKPEIVCLQEANYPASGDETEHFKWFFSGTAGSAVLVNKAITVKSVTFEQVCEQICIADITADDEISFKVISCYIPPSTDYKSEDLWSKLSDIIKDISVKTFFVLAGDFNAELGPTKNVDVGIGVVYHKADNQNGATLRNLVRKAHLKMSSTFGFIKEKNKYYTYKDGEVKSQRDYIVIATARQGHTQRSWRYWHDEYKHAMLGLKVYVSVFRSEKTADGGLELAKNLKESHLVVSTWNTNGASPDIVDKHLYDLYLPIVCVQELFLPGEEDIQTENYTWYTTHKAWSKNVGILIRKSIDATISNFQQLSECLCALDVAVNENQFKVISCHLPLQSDERYETVSTQLTDLVIGLPEDTVFFLAGDFNASRFLKPEEKLVNKTGATDNGFFLQTLAVEANLISLSFRNSFTHISDTKKCNPNHILIPKKHFTNRLCKYLNKWVSFFDNGIVSIFVLGILKAKEVDEQSNADKKRESLYPVKEETIDGIIHKIRVRDFVKPDSSEKTSPEEKITPEKITSLKPEDLEEFKTNSPSAEDLYRMVGPDFVLLEDVNHYNSGLPFSVVDVLANTFKANKLGNLEEETVEVMDEKGKSTAKKIVRIKWHGMVLQAEETDQRRTPFQRVKRKAAKALVNILGQKYHTIKAKRSYFSNCSLPLMMDDPQIEEYFKVLRKQDVSEGLPTITKYIDEFFEKDTDCELFFGPDFSKQEINEIRSHVDTQDKLCVRSLKSSPDLKIFDSLAVFIKRSPQYIRDSLLEKKDNLKYYMIPPCGVGEDYDNFVTKYEGENLKDEQRIIQKYNTSKTPDASQKRTVRGSRGKRLTPRGRGLAGRTSVGRKPVGRTSVGRRQPLPSRNRRVADNRRPNPFRQAQEREYDDRPRTVYPLGQGYGRVDRGRDLRGLDYDSAETELRKVQENYIRRYESLDMEHRRLSEEYRQSFGSGRGDDFDRIAEDGYNRPNNSGMMRPQLDFDQPIETGRFQYTDSRRNGNMTENRRKRPRETMDGLEPKRGRFDTGRDRLPQVQIPNWNSLSPLIIVWPVTVRSIVEERPKQILEYNFPTEIILGSQNSAAVMVTLPMRNGSQKKFCLAVDRQNVAPRTALQLLVKHSSVIKPNPTYFCDGMVPNFVRYRVPCQTNPRTYIILTKYDTGAITPASIAEIFETFKNSFNEDVFFDKNDYTYDEKMIILDSAPKFGLRARHFGEAERVIDRYVCVYKVKDKEEILEEVLKMRGFHPKYILSTNRLPPHLSMNVY